MFKEIKDFATASFKKSVPFLFAILAALGFNSCRTNDVTCPYEAEIERLTELKEVRMNKARAAIHPAKFVERDISAWFNSEFGAIVHGQGLNPINFSDSSDIITRTISEIRLIEAYHNWVFNPRTITELDNKNNAFQTTRAELAALIKRMQQRSN